MPTIPTTAAATRPACSCPASSPAPPATTSTASRTTSTAYDAAGRRSKVSYPDSSSESWTYDWRGDVLTHTDQAGHVTRNAYDLDGELTSTTVADGTADAATTRTAYDGAGRKASSTDADNHTTVYDYNAAGQLWHATDAQGHATAYTYDADGRQRTVTDADNHTTTYSYDARGRLTGTAYPDGSTSATVYDGAGNALTRTDQAGHATAYAYDNVGQLLSVTDPLSHTTTYAYDQVGELTGVTDADRHATAYAYDALGRQTGKAWPDGSREAWAYDPATGDQTAHTLADGHVNTYSYDRMGRLTGIAYFDGSSAGFTYTPTGQRATATDARGVTTYAYDAQDRLTGITTPAGRQVGYTYDAAGNRTALTSPAGATVYSYDAAGRLAGLTDPQGGAYTYRYDAAGNRTGLAYPNGIAASYAYDGLNRLTSISYQRQGSTVASYAYTLAPDGTRTDLAEADGSATHWAYDAANRLTGETMRDPSGAATYQASYTYDQVGNRTGQTINGAATSYSYNSLDQLTSSAAISGTTTYAYNGRGDLTAVAAPAGTTAYSWDAADRLAGATLPDGSTSSYGYDADGRRVSQTVTPSGGGAGTTNYLWDEASTYGDVVAETDGSGNLTTSYILADDQLLAQARGGVANYYLTDGQGSTRALTNSGGGVTDTYRYDAYGVARATQGSTTNAYRYAAQQDDFATGLYNLRARLYNPGTGQFLSRDPATIDPALPAQLDRYAYAANDPVDLSDRSGTWALPSEAEVLAEDVQPQRLIYYRGFAGLAFVGFLTLGLVLSNLPANVPDQAAAPEPTATPDSSTPACDTQQFLQWQASLVANGRTRPADTSKPAGRYQYNVAGPVEWNISTYPGGEYWVDGLDAGSCSIVDAKYSDPGGTQYSTPGSPARTRLLNQLDTYFVPIINSRRWPLVGVIYRTNNRVLVTDLTREIARRRSRGYYVGIPITVEYHS